MKVRIVVTITEPATPALAPSSALSSMTSACWSDGGIAPFALTPGFVDDEHVKLLTESLDRLGPADDPLRVRLLGSLAVALYWSDTA